MVGSGMPCGLAAIVRPYERRAGARPEGAAASEVEHRRHGLRRVDGLQHDVLALAEEPRRAIRRRRRMPVARAQPTALDLDLGCGDLDLPDARAPLAQQAQGAPSE